MDCGRYAKTSSPTILYVVRTVVRIEGFMLTLIRHHRWKKKNATSGCGYASYVRGLDITDAVYDKLVATQQKLRDILDHQVFPMIEVSLFFFLCFVLLLPGLFSVHALFVS